MGPTEDVEGPSFDDHGKKISGSWLFNGEKSTRVNGGSRVDERGQGCIRGYKRKGYTSDSARGEKGTESRNRGSVETIGSLVLRRLEKLSKPNLLSN